MASPARSDETWSLVATTRELVVMAPLASGEVMTAPLRCGWVRDCGGEVRVLQRDGALAGGPAGVSRGGVGVDDPPNVTEPRTEIPEPRPRNVTPGARRVVSLLLRHPSLGDMPRTRQPVPAPGTGWRDRKSTRLNSSHSQISYAVFCLKKKTTRH